MRHIILIATLMAGCDAGLGQSTVEPTKGGCPDPSAKLEEAQLRFKENRPQAALAQYDVKSGVFSGKVVYSFVPRSQYRTFGDSPSVVFDCGSQTMVFIAGE